MDNGEKSQDQQQNKKGIIDRANNAVSSVKNIQSKIQSVKNIQSKIQSAQKIISTVRTAATAVRTGATMANPPVLIAIGLLLLGIMIVLFFSGGGSSDKRRYIGADPSPVPGTDPGTTPQNPIPNLTLEKSGPTAVGNGEDIIYTITAIYGGDLDVTIHDEIPTFTEYREASGEKTVDAVSKIVSWRLAGNTPTRTIESEGRDVYTFTLRVHPIQDNVLVKNLSYASAPGGTTGPAPETSDFSILMAGQGRNTGVLGDETSFVNTAVNNFSQFRNSRSTYESYLRDIYKISLSYNVNPAIVLTIWGVEQSFAINGREFGCKPFDTGFATQVNCSADTLDYWMKRFDEIKAQQNGQLPVYYGLGEGSCPFWEPFLYAYEAYTPVCAMNDGNDGARKNFVDIYKQLLYGVQ